MSKTKTLFINNVKGVLDEAKRILTGVIGSTGIIDRQGESVNPDGWRLENYAGNPTILYGHDYKSFPIAKALKVYLEGGALKFDIEFADTDAGNEAFKLFKGGFLNAFSVGFQVLKWGVPGVDKYDIMEQELFELSVVPVPANPEALANLKSIAPSLSDIFETKEVENAEEDGKVEDGDEAEDIASDDDESDKGDDDSAASEAKTEEEEKTKDVGEVINLASIVGSLDWLIWAFGQNEVKEEVLTLMSSALDSLMKAIALETTIGEKEFTRNAENKDNTSIKEVDESDKIIEKEKTENLDKKTQELLEKMSNYFKRSVRETSDGLRLLNLLNEGVNKKKGGETK